MISRAIGITGLFFCLYLSAAFCQENTQTSASKVPCTATSIHVAIGFSLADSYLLLTDPDGHRLGFSATGKQVPREIAQSFFEDDNTAEMDTNMLPERKPREMVVPSAKPGRYVLALTSRKNTAQSLKITTVVCGKIWREEFTVPSKHIGTTTRLVLTWNFHADGEPQLLMDDHALQPTTKSVVSRPRSATHGKP